MTSRNKFESPDMTNAVEKKQTTRMNSAGQATWTDDVLGPN